MKHHYLSVEAPDRKVVVDFLSDGCSVTLETRVDPKGNKYLWVKAKGCDDRCSILIDTEVEIPETDDRR